MIYRAGLSGPVAILGVIVTLGTQVNDGQHDD